MSFEGRQPLVVRYYNFIFIFKEKKLEQKKNKKQKNKKKRIKKEKQK